MRKQFTEEIKNKFKLSLWQIGLLPIDKCPICGAKLFANHSKDGGISTPYRCAKFDCWFNMEE